MRTKYRITIDEDERGNFDRVLSVFDRKTTTETAIGSDRAGVVRYEIEYTVDLSKYELLYLRLSCKINNVINLCVMSYSDFE